MNERLESSIGTMRESDLLHETDPSPSYPRLAVSPYDDYESSLPLEPDSMIDSPLTGLEEVNDPPLTSLPIVAPSLPSTPRDTTEGASRLLSSSPLPLAQCTELEMGESPGGDASCVEDDSFLWFCKVALSEPSFEEFYSDEVRIGATPSFEHVDPICTDPFDLTPIPSPLLSTTTPSYMHAFHESLGDFKGSHPSLDPYCAYLEDLPRKVIQHTFFDHTFDFSMAFEKCTRAPIFFDMILFVRSYLHHSEMHAAMHDKLLRALTASELAIRVLSAAKEWLMLLPPPIPLS